MKISLLHPGLIIEVERLSGTMTAVLFEPCINEEMGIELKAVGIRNNSPETMLEFTQVLNDFKRRGKRELQLKIKLQANESGGVYSILLRYEGGQHPESGKLKPGQVKEWEFTLLL